MQMLFSSERLHREQEHAPEELGRGVSVGGAHPLSLGRGDRANDEAVSHRHAQCSGRVVTIHKQRHETQCDRVPLRGVLHAQAYRTQRHREAAAAGGGTP